MIYEELAISLSGKRRPHKSRCQKDIHFPTVLFMTLEFLISQHFGIMCHGFGTTLEKTVSIRFPGSNAVNQIILTRSKYGVIKNTYLRSVCILDHDINVVITLLSKTFE